MGYQDDQFFGYNGSLASDPTNPPFNFTDRSRKIRTVVEGSDGKLAYSIQPMQRGFIRSITTTVTGAANNPFVTSGKGVRCNFQFNPQDIEQSVEARRDMYLPILQDPSQFTQPIAGNTSFRFELIFDRTAEVNSRPNSESPVVDGAGNVNNRVLSDPSSVGVLADLKMLHAVIGQGFSSDLVNTQLARFVTDTKTYAKNNFEELNLQVDSEGNFTPVTVDSAVNQKGQKTIDYLNNINTAASQFINSNIGNSAILLPQPVRVVFSSLFMVDGFIMSSSILFTKFSRTMIPIQCKVILGMQAVYLGFARKKTFLQDQLQKTGQDSADTWQGTRDNLAGLRETLNDLRNVNFGLFSDYKKLVNDGSSSITFTDPNSNKKFQHKASKQYPWMFASKNFWYDRGDRERTSPVGDNLFGDYPMAHPDFTAGNFGTYYDSWYREINNGNGPSGRPNFSIGFGTNTANLTSIRTKLFTDLADQAPEFKTKYRVNVYGPFNGAFTAQAAALAMGTEYNFDVSPPSPVGGNIKLMGRYGFIQSPINSTESWDSYIQGYSSYSTLVRNDKFLRAPLDPKNGGRAQTESSIGDIYNKTNNVPAANCITPKSIYDSVVTTITNAVGAASAPSYLIYYFDNTSINDDNVYTAVQAATNKVDKAVTEYFKFSSASAEELVENENIVKMRHSNSLFSTIQSLLPIAHEAYKDKWFVFNVHVENTLTLAPSGIPGQSMVSRGAFSFAVKGDASGTARSFQLGEWTVQSSGTAPVTNTTGGIGVPQGGNPV